MLACDPMDTINMFIVCATHHPCCSVDDILVAASWDNLSEMKNEHFKYYCILKNINKAILAQPTGQVSCGLSLNIVR